MPLKAELLDGIKTTTDRSFESVQHIDTETPPETFSLISREALIGAQAIIRERGQINWRALIDGIGFDADEVRLRASAAFESRPRQQMKIALKALRFIGWYESGMTASEFAKESGEALGVVSETIREFASEILNPDLQLVDEEIDFDSMLRIEEYTQRLKQDPQHIKELEVWAASLSGTTLQETIDAWKAHALCAQTDPEIFTEEVDSYVIRNAKRICAVCEVKERCLEYALQLGKDDDIGTMGGLTASQRRRLRKRLSRQAA